MSISADELIALRRAHLKQKEEERRKAPPPPPFPSAKGRTSSKPSQPGASANEQAKAAHQPPWLQDGAGNGTGAASSSVSSTPASAGTAGGAAVSAVRKLKVRAGLTAAAAPPVRSELAPKVMAPAVPVRGEIDREELVRRKRQRYDEECLPLSSLLEQRGVPLDVHAPMGEGTASYHTLLPLEVFDDASFEELSAEDWRERIAAAGAQGIPCEAHLGTARTATQSAWIRARVVGWSEETNLFRVVAENKAEAASEGASTAAAATNACADGEEPSTLLPRVLVRFLAESPTNFANRLAAAYRRRQAAVAVLHADLCASAIPPDEYQTIDPSVLSRIRALAFTTPMLIEGENNMDAQSLMEEVRVDYHRCMNTDLLRKVTEAPEPGSLGTALLTGPGSQETESAAGAVRARYETVMNARGTQSAAPAYGICPSQCTHFNAVLASFQARSFLAQDPTAGYLLRQLRAMNASLLSQQVFRLAADLEQERPLTLMSFDDVETAAVRESARRLRESWANAYHEMVKGALAMAAKSPDAVHLNFYDEDEYMGSKTQMFFSRVGREMQDTLHHLLKTSIEAFTRFLEHAGNCHVTVSDMATVHVVPGDHPPPTTPFGADARVSRHFLRPPPHTSAPLFRVALSDEVFAKKPATNSSVTSAPAPAGEEAHTPEPETVQEAADSKKENAGATDASPTPTTLVKYSVTTADMRTAVTALVKRCLATHSEIRAVERRLFDFLYDPTTAFVESLRADDPFVASTLARANAVLDRTEVAMNAYLGTFTPLADLISLNVEQYLTEFNTKFPKTRGVEPEIQRHFKRQQEVLDRVPTEVNLGLVQVDCGDLRRRLAAKCAQLVSGILNIMAARAIAKEDEVDEKFSALHDTLVKPTDTPEEVIATKDFIKGIPEQVFDLQVLIQETREIHDVLDVFQRPLSEEEFNKKWRAIGWPSRLDDEINQRLQELEETKRCIVATMNRSQDLFEKEIERTQLVVEQYYQHNNISRQVDIAKDVRAVMERISALRQQANTFNKHEGLFNLEKSDYAAVHQLATDFEPYTALWLTVDDWANAMAEWHTTAFTEIDAEALEQRVMDDYRVIAKCTRDPRLTPDLMHIAEVTLQKMEAFRPLVPTIKFLRTDGMRDRHWDQLSKEIGRDVHPGTTLNTLDDITAMRLRDHDETLMRISEIAAREYQIESSMAKMKAQWEDMRFKLKPHKDTGCFIVTKEVVDDAQEKLDDQMLTTQSLAFSPFKRIFEDEIVEWEATLKLIQDTLDGWMVCQKSWLYLEPIFQSEDIARQLPSEFKRFQLVNKNWKYLTTTAHDVDLILEFCKSTERCVELLKENNETLEVVERGLNQYLENKRASFARFYFLSDDELLTILSDARDPQKIQPQFRKLFESIASIDMRAPDNEMFGMYSHMKEYIPFTQSVLPRKYVENWLTEIEQMMKVSMRSQLDKGIKDAAVMDRKDFILQAPGQVAIAVSQIIWTHECEQSLQQHGSLAPYVPQAKNNLMVLVETVRESLTNLQRMNLSGLITIEVHARDIVDKLAEDKVDNVFDFDWVSQLRSYWENGDCYLRQVEAQFRYGGEYLGNTTRLVITPLTDRIYLTLTGAMHMFLGGAPAGPAGTGKTETVKDLAKAVAKQCVVFNCQEGMTYASMGKFFKGLAQAGAWACFDEFNRIDVEVLSVVAQQVSSLQEAARSRQYRIPFEGTEIVVDPSYSVFITMNPGYAGRTELPDNLKVLFRPVACMVPDYAMIAEIRLFSFGYSDSRKLAQKMVATFRLSSEQLSSQDHYDFGMRAVNTVISAAGLMKRENPKEREDVLLLRALRDSNAPKFLVEDLLLFNGIISDLFPGVELPPADYGDFVLMLEEKAAEFKLQPTEMFIKKCIQLYEMSVLRHGQMSVGPTMGGKTSAMRVLQAAMTALRKEKGLERFAEVKTYTLNPKSITMAQLYGGFDDATGEWRDGIVGELFRAAARDTSDARQWVVFDGPVDALWIESMNTVLDENKKLCLISGEIITMTPYMNCWFEVEDLAVASPATVSRAGMIYMSPDTCIGVASTVRNWQMHRLPSTMDPYKPRLQELCEQLFPALMQFVQTQVTEYSPSAWPNLAASCFNIFASFLTPYTPTRTYDVPQDKLDLLREIHMHFLVFAIVWSFGATGDKASRQRFDKFLRDELRLRNVNIELPVIGCLQDYEFVPEERRWVPWTDRLPPFTTQVTRANMADIIVPTADVARYKYMARLLLTNSYHFLACGPTGTGKTVLLQQLLMSEMPKEFTPIFFTFSARTSANQTQDLIFSKFEVRRRASPQVWGAPVGKKFVVFVDDMNMPMKEQYGAQPPIEILRQYMDHHGWYDRRTREFFNIVDVIYAGAMGPPGGGRNKISNRFLRHFNQIAFPDIDDDNMKRIFTSLLDSYFTPFSEDVRGKVQSLVAASIDVFSTVLKELRPTPSRPHYLFNMRDLSKVIAGMTNALPQTTPTVPSFVRLWMHEEMRTFKDRLVSSTDREWFDKLLHKQVQKQFKLSLEEVTGSSKKSANTGASGAEDNTAKKSKAPGELLFVDFMGSKTNQRVYQQVDDFGALVSTIEKELEEYNHQAMGHKLDLVMFADAVQHVCRIARTIRNPGGHVLLLGVGGSGRQSLARLAAHLTEFDLFQIEVSKGYGTNAWHEDLKEVLRKVAFRNKQVLFLITDTQIVQESMLEDVNNLLNSGEVPNLFLGQEFDDVLNAMKPICMAESVPLDKVSVYARFVRACRLNLHISLCMSPLGEPFRARLRMFPALVNCCTIDWFDQWPADALRSVATSYFAKVDQLTTEQGAVCTEVCVKIHSSVEEMSKRFLAETRRYNYVTPTSFLELLKTFITLLQSQTEENTANQSRLVNGLAKLRETEDAVAGLQQTLTQSQPILLEKSESIKALVAEMEEQTASAEVTKKEAQKEREAVASMQAECQNIEQEAQDQLAEALPELDRALESLKNLKSSQITEVAGYKAPTPGVVMTMQGICIMFQIKPVIRQASPMEEKKPDYWATAKEQLLNNPNLLMQRLINYDKEHIPEKLIQAVMPLVTSEDFTPKKIAGASQACAAMCQWTHAMVRFHEVNKKVEPLRKRLAVAQEANREAQEKLQQAEARLEEVARTLADMQARKESAEKEMADLEDTVKKTELKLQRAAMLINGLANEKKSWTTSVETLKGNATYLMGNMLAAAGQIAYCGPFTSTYRKALVELWQAELKQRHILHSEHLSVFGTLQDPVETQEWGLNGLPLDTLSVENAIILTNARRWPLMIDPQTQANRWIRQTYKESLEVLKPSQKDLIKRIEFCIRAGRPVLLENVTEEIDASLNPLLGKQTFVQGGTEMIRISDTAIPWNPKFKFFMTTKYPNPHFIPEIMVRVTLLNFFITPQGLEDQLLGVVVGQERRELETRRSDLIQNTAAMKADLADIQRTILRKLEEVEGDILDDVELIEYLNESKAKTTEIVAKVAEAEEAEVEINASREEYRPIARHSSCLYFCCSTLSNVDPMYQYSLQWFVQLFITGIEQATRSDDLAQRLQNLQDYFTFSFYQNISRSLFEMHKLMFSFYLCIRIMDQDNLIVDEEFRFLLQGPSIIEKADNNPDDSWLMPSTWNEISFLGKHFEAFKGIRTHMAENLTHYRDMFMSSNAHRQPMQGEWAEKLSPMQRMMFLRCLRPDKLMEAVQDFVAEQMGERFIRPPPFDLLISYKDSTPTTPLIFVLSQGADPYEDWKRFAETQHMSKKLYDISLGQGQGPRAERMLQEGMETGAWVLLQNCHLATSWMPTLERLVEGMSGGASIHPSFRLWLTSMPNPHFPVSVLQNGVKMTNEPPKGMQANVTRSVLSYNNDYLESCKKPQEFKKLFFAMCFFHGLIQERRKFGPLGWNIAYEYTSGDLGCCVDQIKMFLDKYAEVPYKVIRELSGHIHYGGRVTDDWDRRTLTTLLERFVDPGVMEDGYRFSALPDYQSIPVTNQQGYLEYVASWPINTSPEAFGLHENADITCARNETFETLAAIVLLQGESGGAPSSGGAANAKTPDEEVLDLALVIKGKLCGPFDIDKMRKRYPTKYEDSMNTVLVQEAIRFNHLLNVVHATLDNLPLAIKGEIVMSKELEDVYRSIYNNAVPGQWAERAYPSLKTLAAWVDDLVLRLAMIQSWYEHGHPKVYWISGFFFPQAFLTGILQNCARQLQISIDTISYDYEWLSMDPAEVQAAPSSGCYIHGMFMEGARMDPATHHLVESKPKVLFEPTPMLWLKPVIDRVKPTSGVYQCPLYKTVRRAGTLSTTGHSTNYVLTVEVPSPDEDPKHWIRRGVAMVCALNA